MFLALFIYRSSGERHSNIKTSDKWYIGITRVTFSIYPSPHATPRENFQNSDHGPKSSTLQCYYGFASIPFVWPNTREKAFKAGFVLKFRFYSLIPSPSKQCCQSTNRLPVSSIVHYLAVRSRAEQASPEFTLFSSYLEGMLVIWGGDAWSSNFIYSATGPYLHVLLLLAKS